MQIKTENLTFTYGKSSSISNKAVDNVSVTFCEGDFCGIIGKTGSGKSTFIQHLNGLIKVQKDSGKVLVGEFDLTNKKCDFKAVRSKVGMVFQYPEYQLFAETVEADVSFGIRNFMPHLKEEEVKELTKKAIETVGLNYEKLKNKSPFELSGGQKRRVAIAGVIVTRPEILILDEPAVGLDPIGKREFLKLLKRLHNDFVKTIIIVSHDMNLVSEYCNRVLVFSNGKLMAQGKPKDIYLSNLAIDNGLKDCMTARLTKELSADGIAIDSDLTIDDFTDKVAEYFKTAKENSSKENSSKTNGERGEL